MSTILIHIIHNNLFLWVNLSSNSSFTCNHGTLSLIHLWLCSQWRFTYYCRLRLSYDNPLIMYSLLFGSLNLSMWLCHLLQIRWLHDLFSNRWQLLLANRFFLLMWLLNTVFWFVWLILHDLFRLLILRQANSFVDLKLEFLKVLLII